MSREAPDSLEHCQQPGSVSFRLAESRETATPANVVLRHWSSSFGLAVKTGLHRALNLNVP